jgi:hypothetical protein
MKGWLANQKGVAIFQRNDNGEQMMADFTVPSKYSLKDVRKVLDDHGVEFRTLIPTAQGTKVMALAFDTANVDSVIRAPDNFGVEVKYAKGKGEIIESSDGTRGVYEAIVNQQKSEAGVG